MLGTRAGVCIIFAMLASLSPVASRAQAAPDRQLVSESPTAQGCTVREISREPLVVDRVREMYVEPVVVLQSGSSILLAGNPNYLFQPGFPGMARDFVRDSVFGAVLESDGRARMVSAPRQVNPKVIAEPRALPARGGGWAVVFAELKHPHDPQNPDTVVAYWYGVFDGQRWTSVERLPRPSEGLMEPNTASDIVQRGDTMAFAAAITTSNGSDIAIFERRAGTWSLEILPTRRAAYPRLAFSDSLGMLLFLVRPDTTLPRDRNAAFVYTRDPDWRMLHKLLPGLPEPVHDPVFSSSSRGPVLTWMVLYDGGGNQARAAIGPVEAGVANVIALDSDVTHIAVVRDFDGPPLWAIDVPDAGGNRQLRLMTDSGGTGVVIAASPTPYTGYFAATGIDSTNILVTGPLFRSERPNPSLVTLLIRSRVECHRGAP